MKFVNFTNDDRPANEKIGRIGRGIARCQRCERSRTRIHSVPGEGRIDTGRLFIGEAPGKKEDGIGRPFVGRAGTYLDKVLEEKGVARRNIFITSILKCYHPRQPQKKQIQSCISWTREQIDVIGPKAVLVMGLTAAQALFCLEDLKHAPRMLKLEGVPCVVTCHPAAAMRFPERDRQFRQGFEMFLDLCKKSS